MFSATWENSNSRQQTALRTEITKQLTLELITVREKINSLVA